MKRDKLRIDIIISWFHREPVHVVVLVVIDAIIIIYATIRILFGTRRYGNLTALFSDVRFKLIIVSVQAKKAKAPSSAGQVHYPACLLRFSRLFHVSL